jgi:hypothetical protein
LSYHFLLVISFELSSLLADPLNDSLLTLTTPKRLLTKPLKQWLVTAASITLSTGRPDITPLSSSPTRQRNEMLSVELVSLSATLGSTAICTLPVEMKHCISPVIEPIVDLLHVAPLLLRHELTVLVFVAHDRALDVDTRLTLTVQCTSVALLVELAGGLQLMTAATFI